MGEINLKLIVQFLDKSSRLGYNLDERIIRLDKKLVGASSAWVQNEKF